MPPPAARQRPATGLGPARPGRLEKVTALGDIRVRDGPGAFPGTGPFRRESSGSGNHSASFGDRRSGAGPGLQSPPERSTRAGRIHRPGIHHRGAAGSRRRRWRWQPGSATWQKWIACSTRLHPMVMLSSPRWNSPCTMPTCFSAWLPTSLFTNPLLRSPASVASNKLGQPGLWRFGISGDLPIVLLRIGADTGLELAPQILQAHRYWRWLRPGGGPGRS